MRIHITVSTCQAMIMQSGLWRLVVELWFQAAMTALSASGILLQVHVNMCLQAIHKKVLLDHTFLW
jgi:hypothetical protein